MYCRFFEGLPGRRLPKSHLGIELQLEIVGMAWGHSMLSEGPIEHPSLHPGLFRYLCMNPGEHVDQFVVAVEFEDIPRTAQTLEVISLIEMVSIITMYV